MPRENYHLTGDSKDSKMFDINYANHIILLNENAPKRSNLEQVKSTDSRNRG